MIFKANEINLHSHTCYCHHAKGTAADYVQAAREGGHLKAMGISEHAPLKGQMGNNERMDFCDLEAYTSDVRKLKEETHDIRILLGSECEGQADQLSFYEEELLGRLGYDYLCMGIHFVEDDTGRHYIGRYTGMARMIRKYVDTYCRCLDSGLFLFGCHPDLFAPGFPQWNADAKAASLDIIQCALDLDIPLEYNGYGFRKPLINGRRPYTVDEFWDVANAMGVKICTNSDAHNPKDIYEENGLRSAAEHGISLIGWDIEGDSIKVSV